MYAKITKDLLFEKEIFDRSQVGLQWGERPVGNLIQFRLLDDDRILYYEGEGDDEALETVFFWAQRDSGVTILQTRVQAGWVDCIG